MRSSTIIKSSIVDLREELDALVKASEAANRDLTAQESQRADTIVESLSKERQALEQASAVEKERFDARKPEFEQKLRDHMAANGLSVGGSLKTATMHDSRGTPIHCLGKTDSVASTLAVQPVSNGLGELIRCVSTGRVNSWTPDSVRAALGGTTNLGGGILVPSELAALVIDKARAASVIMQAGAMTIPMATSDLTVARVLTDPTMQVKAENAMFDEASINFGSVKFTASTIGCVITASRELAEDAPNFAQIIEGVIARALAAKLDYYAIQGVNPAPNGLVSMSGIGETGSIGALAWEDLAAASSEVRQANHSPNAIILNVETYEDLQILTSGDGTNAAKNWLMAPPALDGQQILASNNVPLANAIVGDFSYAYWGIRSDARIEMSSEANEAFERHQLKLKIVFRGDFQVVDFAAFHRLAGITS